MSCVCQVQEQHFLTPLCPPPSPGWSFSWETPASGCVKGGAWGRGTPPPHRGAGVSVGAPAGLCPPSPSLGAQSIAWWQRVWGLSGRSCFPASCWDPMNDPLGSGDPPHVDDTWGHLPSPVHPLCPDRRVNPEVTGRRGPPPSL